MGLDMYLRGERFYRYQKNPKDDKGRPIVEEIIDLGYGASIPTSTATSSKLLPKVSTSARKSTWTGTT